MSSKPLVALILPQRICPHMFNDHDLARLREAAEVIGPPETMEPRHVKPLLAEAVVAVGGWGSPRFDADLLSAAPRLKLIAYSAGSVKGIVSDAMYDRGVKVTTSAAANAVPVAQYTVAMMVALLKQVPWIAAPYTAGYREEMLRLKGQVRELQDMSVGIISASRVGREVIKLLQSGYRRLRIRLYDPVVTPQQAAEMGVELTSLEEACRSEVVSIHAPKIRETRHMLSARTLALLPDHAVLINTSRGALIDEEALVAEVRRRPLYVLLDVTDPEPPAPDSPLRRERNIILTPHVAGAVANARRDMGQLAIDEALRFLRGEPLEHEVTREMLPTQA